MKKQILFFIFPIICISLFSFENFDKNILEQDFKNTWHLDYKNSDNILSICEWTKENENVYNWTELITMQLLKNCFNKAHFYNTWMSSIKNNIPDKLWYEKIISEDKNSIVVLWAILPPSSSEQTEFAKIIETKDGLFLIRYTAKNTKKIDKKWINFILSTDYENNFFTSE